MASQASLSRGQALDGEPSLAIRIPLSPRNELPRGSFFNMYWVYILYSEKGQRYYIGQTQDVAERLERHNCGYEKSTSPYRPYKLVCKIEKPTRGDAMQLEKKLKNLNTEDLQKFIQKYGC